jgi:hypothetical protein
MSPKFILALLTAVLLVLGAVFIGNQFLTRPAAGPPPDSAAAVSPAAAKIETASPPPMAPAPATANILTPEQQSAAIEAETDRLQQWSVNDDPASLSNILNDLNSPEKEIRDAAIEAVKQFGSTNAIPALKAAAANTTDTEEQTALLEAADFLSLPTIADSQVQQPKTPGQIQAAAQKQAQRPRHGPKNNPPSTQQTTSGDAAPGN